MPCAAAKVFRIFFFPSARLGALGILSEWKITRGTKGAFRDKGGVCRLQRAAASVPTRSAASGDMIRVNYAEENFRNGGFGMDGRTSGREGRKTGGAWLDFNELGGGADSAICILSRLPTVWLSVKLAPRQTLRTKNK